MSDPSDDLSPSPHARARLGAEETDLKRETAPTDVAPGTVIGGQFQITGAGLAGGMGVVYPVLDVELNEPCALKLMHPYLVVDALAQAQFREEAKNARRLADKGVVRVHHFGDWAGQKYLTMEWVAGGSLRAELRRRSSTAESRPRLPLGIVLPLITRVTEALAYAHEEGVIHLDLKPENILLAPVPQAPDYLAGGGRPKLADFGLSKLLSRDELSQSARAAGTAYYTARRRRPGRGGDGAGAGGGVLDGERRGRGGTQHRDVQEGGGQSESACKRFFERERPHHRLALDAFYLDRYEITNTLFERFVNATSHRTTAEREGSSRAWRQKDGRVLRGGSWYFTPIALRSAGRGNRSQDYRYSTLAFRCARGLSQGG